VVCPQQIPEVLIQKQQHVLSQDPTVCRTSKPV